jgi:hypothetical protein
MGFFYFDESIHPKGKFSLGAYVYSETPLDSRVAAALTESGLRPGVDEFKSGARMDTSPKQLRARDLLRSTVQDQCGIGIVVAPDQPREILGIESLDALNKILLTTRFRSKNHQVFFDEGIFCKASALQEARIYCFSQPCQLNVEQHSHNVMGLQVADFVAHSCSIMLLASLGLLNKKVKAGENSGYPPDLDVELEFELWASLRYSFFADPAPSPETWESQLDHKVNVAARGLHIAETCDLRLKSAALARFGEMYLGCIH